MKKILILAIMMTMILSVSMQAQAALQNLGTDSSGNQLIYDTDLDITWYDLTSVSEIWSTQMTWASELSVTFGSNVYDDWRLPTTTQPDSSCSLQYTDPDGILPLQGYGFNCTGSELGHLYYTELGNTASATLINKGDFKDLQTYFYYSGTEYAPDTSRVWNLSFVDGRQSGNVKPYQFHAIAVRDGLAVAPEPISSILFLIGGVTLGFRRLRKRVSV